MQDGRCLCREASQKHSSAELSLSLRAEHASVRDLPDNFCLDSLPSSPPGPVAAVLYVAKPKGLTERSVN